MQNNIAGHKSRWLRNREFAERIGIESSDWFAVAIHYSALHLVNAFLILDGVQEERRASHSALHQTLKATSRYQQIWKHFRPLCDASHSARYTPASSDVISMEDAEKLAHHYLNQVEGSILRLAKWPETPPKLIIRK